MHLKHPWRNLWLSLLRPLSHTQTQVKDAADGNFIGFAGCLCMKQSIAHLHSYQMPLEKKLFKWILMRNMNDRLFCWCWGGE